ncbi:class I SAM-dependent methyltransferase [Desulfovibrio sp. OttesenSCG-928-C14]|nr:class I SAM-dependent methyltransferase [Desulfovibrio sp. OttesenSCG-928-C14]
MAALPEDLLVFSRRLVREGAARALGKAVKADLSAPPLFLDATAGNGVDSEFLALLARDLGGGIEVAAFDVQEEALRNTGERLEKAGLSGAVRLIPASHADLVPQLGPARRCLAAMYNLGFLPGSASPLSTGAESSTASLAALQALMLPGGVISVHCYTGHPGGAEEHGAVRDWAEGLPWQDWRTLRYEFCNKPRNREVLYLAVKLPD